jgi:hypothetical protein
LMASMSLDSFSSAPMAALSLKNSTGRLCTRQKKAR